MDISITTPASLTSIDVALVKASKRITHSLEDSLIDFWIKVADAFVENETKTALMQRTYTMNVSRVLPTIQLPFPPLISISSIKYTADGASEVDVDLNTGITRRTVEMLPQVTISDLSRSAAGSMTVVYTAGYASADAVPPELRQASLLMVGHYLTAREATYMDPRAILIDRKIQFGVNDLVRHWIVPNTNEPLNGGY